MLLQADRDRGSGTGESLAQHPVRAGDHVLADRGYSTARGLRHVAEAGGKLIVRVNTGSLPYDRTVRIHHPPSLASTLTEDDVIDGGDVVPGWRLPVREIFDS